LRFFRKTKEKIYWLKSGGGDLLHAIGKRKVPTVEKVLRTNAQVQNLILAAIYASLVTKTPHVP
jgi:hypothetical protein